MRSASLSGRFRNLASRRLGIQLERITPGHPEQNGRHERMHLTLKTQATKPPAANVLQQQGCSISLFAG